MSPPQTHGSSASRWCALSSPAITPSRLASRYGRVAGAASTRCRSGLATRASRATLVRTPLPIRIHSEVIGVNKQHIWNHVRGLHIESDPGEQFLESSKLSPYDDFPTQESIVERMLELLESLPYEGYPA